MTAEESLSVAVRGHLSGAGAMSEVKMFGGTGFKRGLLLRVGKDRYRDALAWPGARPMEMRGRTMEGFRLERSPGGACHPLESAALSRRTR
jgi:hypothetical protein